MGQGHKRETVNAPGCSLNWAQEMKYLIFSFPRSGDEAKRSVEFRHATRNAENSAESGM